MNKIKGYLSTLIICTILIFIFMGPVFGGTTKEYKIKFQTACGVTQVGKTSTAYVSAVVKLKNSDSERFLDLTCSHNPRRCTGSMLTLSDKAVGHFGIMVINFIPKEFVISGSKALISYSNETYSIDDEAGTVSADYDFSNNSKPSKETWIGTCKN